MKKLLKLAWKIYNFSNSSGIGDPENYSTVRDIMKMSRYLIANYPEYYSYFKETTFTWDRNW